jgi:hypothetical protein
MDLKKLWAFIELAKTIYEKGGPAVKAVIEAARDNGIETDNATLDAIIVDADRREAIARHEAEG